MKTTEETILCAAIWIDDGVEHMHQPTKTGLVLCGWGHHCIIQQATVTGFGTRLQRSGENQGFLTSLNRYVDREEAYHIAEAAGQIWSSTTPGRLYSDDLRPEPRP